MWEEVVLNHDHDPAYRSFVDLGLLNQAQR